MTEERSRSTCRGPPSPRRRRPRPLDFARPFATTTAISFPTSSRSAQYQAFLSRRIVEIARRLDQFPACNGRLCRNGIVTSISAPEFSRALRVITTRIQERLTIG